MIYLFIFSFIYIITLSLIYFSKKRLNNVDNKIYSLILLVNIVGVLIDILQYVFIRFYFSDTIILFISKTFLLYVITWTSIYTLYVLSIRRKNDELLHKNKTTYLLLITYLFFLIITIFLPLNYKFNNNGTMYTDGRAVRFVYLAVLYYIFLMFISMLLNLRQHGKKDKYMPVLVFLIMGIISSILQKINPTLLLTSPIETFITILTYFFIENPDVKMIEQLEKANIEAQRANRAKSDFLSSMSHEIRTPLNAIIGFSEAIKEDNTVEACHEDANDIIMAGQNLLEIINGILDISKIEAGKMEIVNTNYNLKENCKNLAKLIKPRIGEKAIDFRVSIADDIPDILYGDSAKVKEVITNILTNAVKYTASGFIDFRVSCINKDDISTIFISVEDTGRGIKREQLDNLLFSKFQRLDEDKNTTIEGTGLGMAITKSLVDMMGGKIIVQSKYGIGSKFSVYLKQKIVTMVDNTNKDEKEEKNISYNNKKILIVDDNMLNLKVASRLLKEFELEPDTLSSGYECIDKIKGGSKYDLILMDDMMPKLSGIETFACLKEIEGFSTPVVILTANAVAGEKEKYINLGFNDYLAKPIDKTELKRVLKEYLK